MHRKLFPPLYIRFPCVTQDVQLHIYRQIHLHTEWMIIHHVTITRVEARPSKHPKQTGRTKTKADLILGQTSTGCQTGVYWRIIGGGGRA